MYHPVGKKFARNRSISYDFRDIATFSFSAKIQDGRRKWRKLKFPPFAQDSCTTLWVKNSLEIALSLMVFQILTLLPFSAKNPRWPPKVAKIEIFPLCTRDPCTTLRVKNSLKIALSLTVCEIFLIFDIFSKSSNKVAITHLYTEQQV